jgi:hypothetical protein
MWEIDSNTNTGMFPKVGLLEETRGGGKEEMINRVGNIEIHHMCIGTI